MQKYKKSRFQNWKRLHFTGDPGQNRTGDLPLRRRLLYPTELRNHMQLLRAIASCSSHSPAIALNIIYQNQRADNTLTPAASSRRDTYSAQWSAKARGNRLRREAQRAYFYRYYYQSPSVPWIAPASRISPLHA